MKVHATLFFLPRTKELVHSAEAVCFLNVYTSALSIPVLNPLVVGQGYYYFNSRPIFLCDYAEVQCEFHARVLPWIH